MVPADGWHQAARTRVACRSLHERGTGLFCDVWSGAGLTSVRIKGNTISGSLEITNVVISSALHPPAIGHDIRTALRKRNWFAARPICIRRFRCTDIVRLGRNRCSYTVPRACTVDAIPADHSSGFATFKTRRKPARSHADRPRSRQHGNFGCINLGAMRLHPTEGRKNVRHPATPGPKVKKIQPSAAPLPATPRCARWDAQATICTTAAMTFSMWRRLRV